MLANVNENFTQYALGNVEFTNLKIIYFHWIFFVKVKLPLQQRDLLLKMTFH